MSVEKCENEIGTLFIVIPAYNEQENIDQCFNSWYQILMKYGNSDSKLIMVDDGSTDSTLHILKNLEIKNPQLIVLSKNNGGHGSAVLYGYRYAIRNGADWIFQTDSDGQTNPGEFEAFWESRNEWDVVIGKRNKRGDGILRKLIEDVVCALIWGIFGIKVTDANAPFRLMKASILQKYIDKLPTDFNIPNIMFTTYFVYHKEKVVFLPITFGARKNGKNSVNIKSIMRIGVKAIGDFRRLKKNIN